MRMSNKLTSGRSRRAISTASRPSAASPTTRQCRSCASRIMRSPVRTKILIIGHQHADRHATAPRRLPFERSVAGKHGADPPTPGRRRWYRTRAGGKRAAPSSFALLGHANQAVAVGRHVGGGLCTPSSVTVRSHPIVAAPTTRTRTSRRIAGMSNGVCDRLLGQPVQRRVNSRPEADEIAGQLQTSIRRPGPSSVRRSMSAKPG